MLSWACWLSSRLFILGLTPQAWAGPVMCWTLFTLAHESWLCTFFLTPLLIQSFWYLEISPGGSIYAIEISKYYKPSLLAFFLFPGDPVVKHKHATASTKNWLSRQEWNLCKVLFQPSSFSHAETVPAVSPPSLLQRRPRILKVAGRSGSCL